MTTNIHELAITKSTIATFSKAETIYEIDLSKFRVKAVVDWLDIEIETRSSTNYQCIQKKSKHILDEKKGCWVTTKNKRRCGADTQFRIRLHDLKTYTDLIYIVAEIDKHFPLACEPKITAIEVSIDFRSKEQIRQELEKATIYLKQSLDHVGVKPREYNDKKKIIEMKHRSSELTSYRTWAAGEKGDPEMSRIYLKEVDRNLPIADIAKHSARVEISLNYKATHNYFDSISSFQTFKFQKFTHYFKFRKINPNIAEGDNKSILPLIHEILANEIRKRGQQAIQPSKKSRRKHTKVTIAHEKMNDRVKDALRNLTNSFFAKKGVRILDGYSDFLEKNRAA